MYYDAEEVLQGLSLRWPSFLNVPPSQGKLEDCLFWVIPVPYDSTASFQPGARFGPSAIIQASHELEDWDELLSKDSSVVGISTLPALEPIVDSPSKFLDEVFDVVSIAMKYEKLPVLLGGDHSITIGSVRAIVEKFPGVQVIYLDAHADFRDSYMGSRFGHASVAKRLSEFTEVIHVGVRSISERELADIPDYPRTFFEAPRAGIFDENALGEILSVLGENVYITIDLDVLDPSLMPSVGNPQPGGLSWNGINDLLRVITSRSGVVGFDVVELAPNLGYPHASFTAAKLVYRLMGYVT